MDSPWLLPGSSKPLPALPGRRKMKVGKTADCVADRFVDISVPNHSNPNDPTHQLMMRNLYVEKRQLLEDVERLKW